MHKSLIYIIALLMILNSCNERESSNPHNWELGTYTGVLTDFSLEQFNQLKFNGIKYIELGTAKLVKMTPEERVEWIENIKNLSEKAGIEVWSVHLPYSRTLDVSVTDSQLRENMINECTSIIELCSKLQPKKFIIHPSAEPIEDTEREQRIQHSIESLKVLNKTAQSFNARLTVECLPRTCLGNTSEELLRIVNAVGNNVEICFDSNHLLKEKPEEFIAKAGNL
ncbi:MAG TPA: TIM barrel protein, partial [Mariniphaga sp.]|nr:TIM barrel protein [Mariniphaga sp.]